MIGGMVKHLTKKNVKGFTLVELMIVIAIIGLLAAIAVPNFIAYRDRSFCGKVESDAHNAANSAHEYLTENADLTGFSYNWSNDVANGTASLDGAGVLTVTADDGTGRCPYGNTYTIVSNQTSGSWGP